MPRAKSPRSKDHYRRPAEGYLQVVFKVLEACDIRTDLVAKVAQALADEPGEQDEPEKDIASLRAEIRNLARSEIGHLFKTPAGGPQTASESESGPGVQPPPP